MLKKFLSFNTRVLMLLSALIAINAQAYDCSGLPVYPPINAPEIVAGDEYQYKGHAYRCLVTGWCGLSGWAYEPGVGMYWHMAWEDLGPCDLNIIHPPSVTVVPVPNMVSGEQHAMRAQATDDDGDIVSWQLTVYLYTVDGLVNPQIIGSGQVTPTASLDMSASWVAPTDSYSYALHARVEDQGGLVSESVSLFLVSQTPKPNIALSAEDVILLGQTVRLDATSWSADGSFGSPTWTATPDTGVWGAPNMSSSSGGMGAGFNSLSWRDFTPVESGSYIISAAVGDFSDQIQLEVLPADGLPVVRLEAPDTADIGELVTFEVTALDAGAIASLSVMINGELLTPVSSEPIGQQQYGIRQSYQWTATSGVNVFNVRAVDNEGFSSELNHSIDVAVGPIDGCAALGIDGAGINIYPDWPRLDWKGDPSHALGGDRLIHQNNLYQALWWTQAAPGSDSSWMYVCSL